MEDIANIPRENIQVKQGEKGDGLTRPFSKATTSQMECPKCKQFKDYLLGTDNSQACEECYQGGPEAPPAGFNPVTDAYRTSNDLDVK